uniref:CD99 antigen-like protein 2 n=1 Tax=Pavo cristatus TaxID=9049 RepID=A0A8C9FA73_PAVCR
MQDLSNLLRAAASSRSHFSQLKLCTVALVSHAAAPVSCMDTPMSRASSQLRQLSPLMARGCHTVMRSVSVPARGVGLCAGQAADGSFLLQDLEATLTATVGPYGLWGERGLGISPPLSTFLCPADNRVETGTIAGIASALAMALVGAVSSYISYQQKKFCFSIQQGLNAEYVKGENMEAVVSEEPQVKYSVLETQSAEPPKHDSAKV